MTWLLFANIFCSENVCCINNIQMHRLILSGMQTLWNLIRLLLKKQSDLGPYCLLYRLSKYMSRREDNNISELGWDGGKLNVYPIVNIILLIYLKH